MNIPIEREPKELSMSGMLENCIFCKKQTPYWHTETNNPVCPDCSKTHDVSELNQDNKTNILKSICTMCTVKCEWHVNGGEALKCLDRREV